MRHTDVVCCCGRHNKVSLCVGHFSELCKNSGTDQDAIYCFKWTVFPDALAIKCTELIICVFLVSRHTLRLIFVDQIVFSELCPLLSVTTGSVKIVMLKCC